MLTICSVSHNSAEYLNLNKQYMLDAQNLAYDWLVYENGAEEVLSAGFTKFRGENNVLPDKPGFINQGSSNHAAGLNFLIQQVKTRYVLLLDPDFFICRPIGEILSIIQEKGFEFFGAPYMPESGKNRVQDFPVAFCMFIDLERVDRKELDFTPSNNSEKFIQDTGFSVYNKFVGRANYDFALPSSFMRPVTKGARTTTQNISKKNPYGFDEYFYQDKLFGIHAHMKLHLRKEQELLNRKKWQLDAVKVILNDKTIPRL